MEKNTYKCDYVLKMSIEICDMGKSVKYFDCHTNGIICQLQKIQYTCT